MIGSILLVRSSSPISWIIRKLTKSDYSHVAISVVEDDSIVIDADSFRRVKVHPNDFEVSVKIDVNLAKDQQDQLLDYLLKQVDLQYDYLQVLGFAVRLLGLSTKTNLWDSKKKIECVELVDKAFLSIGIDLLPGLPDGDATPGQLAEQLFEHYTTE